jgi:hypothetical protein
MDIKGVLICRLGTAGHSNIPLSPILTTRALHMILSGWVSRLMAAKQLQKGKILSLERDGSLCLFANTIDVLGNVPEEGEPWPFDGSKSSGHPYSRVG